MTHVAILVPGIMGSQLELNGEVIWPGSLLSLVGSYKKMDKLMNPNLVPTDVIRSFSISEQYQSLVNDLGKCDFKEKANPPTLFVCPYDWRKDNRLAADSLANVIEKAINAHGNATDCEISIVAHSMGGLVSRYYLESGRYNDRPGYAAVRRLLTLATPHRGSPLALCAAVGMEKRLFLTAEQVHELVSDSRYPALYQLLPPPGEPFVWSENKDAEYGTINIYDPQTAFALKLNSENLKAAKTFHESLDFNKRPTWQGKPIRYFLFVGTRQTTISAVTLLPIGAAEYRVRRMELEDAGDGTVPAWSAQITGMQGQPVGGEHITIYRNDILRRTMGILLGKAGVLAPVVAGVEVAIRERVVNPNDLVHISLTFTAGTNTIDGRLDVQRAQQDPNGSLIGFANPIFSYPVIYKGVNAEKLGVILNGPAVPGIYRIAYVPANQTAPAGSDELFVQQ